MLRSRTSLSRAALVLALALLALPAAANQTIGGACTTGTADSPQSADGNNVVCIGSVWQYPAYQFGSTSASCNATNAGMVQYTGGVLKACNGTSWIPIDGGIHFIATQTASSSASLQFTNLPTSYNTLFLNCAGILASDNTTYLEMFVGEGAGPTWKTGGNYTASSIKVENGTPAGYASGTANPDLTGGATDYISSSKPWAIKMYIDNVGSSTLYKNATFFLSENDNNGGNVPTTYTGISYWNNDTNAITGLELVAEGGGTISSGTCSLYGMN